MLIGIDASRANREEKTGVEWYSYYLIQELKKIPLNNGINFILYTPNKLKGELAVLPKNWQEKILKWPLKYLWTQVKLSWEMFKNSPDVLFIPSHALPFFIPKKIKTVITLHDTGFRRYPKAYSFWQRFYTNFVYRNAVKKATKIIVPSNFTKNELINLYHAKTEKIKVVYFGIDKNLFKPTIDQKILEKYRIKKPYILFVGRLEEKKNIKNLISAFLLLNQPMQLVLVGKPGYGYKEIKKLILRSKNILEIGYVRRNDLPYLYSAAELFILSSFYEGFGFPGLEAMACGCPVIAANQTCLPEIYGPAAIYFDPNSIKEIAGRVEEIINNKSLRKELIKKGFEQVKKYSWERCARETLQILLTGF